MAVAITRGRSGHIDVLTSRTGRAVLGSAVFAVLTVLALLIALRISPPSALAGVAGVALAATVIWMFFSRRYALTLGVLVLYLGLLDGYLKLKTGAQIATLGRDLLLYAIALGFLARVMQRHERLSWPPLTALVAAFVLLTVVQVFNPGSGGLGGAIAALRPHLEFVPLFVLAYMTVTTKRRLFALLLILAIVGAANGAVSLMQFNLTPEELSAWGPGYAERIDGSGDVSGRTFSDAAGEARVRPFGLGADSGGGGIAGLLALPAALALIGLIGRRREALVALPLLAGIGLAIITSQGRGILIAAIGALLAYAMLTMLSRRLVPTLVGILMVGLVISLTSSALSEKREAGALSRYETITPTNVSKTTQKERGSSIALAPSYAVKYPLGAGLGSVGPAYSVSGASSTTGVNGETEFNFLIVEIGVLGAAAFLAFVVSLLRISATGIRRVADAETRLLLAALAAPIFAIAVLFVSGPASSGVPAGPYLWGAGGVLLYWLRPAARVAATRRANAAGKPVMAFGAATDR